MSTAFLILSQNESDCIGLEVLVTFFDDLNFPCNVQIDNDKNSEDNVYDLKLATWSFVPAIAEINLLKMFRSEAKLISAFFFNKTLLYALCDLLACKERHICDR